MVAPLVASDSETVCVPRYVPAARLRVGVATACTGPLPANVHDSIFWLEVAPPVPPVKPTYAVFPPTMAGISTVQLLVNVLLETGSNMVIARVVPS